MQRFVFIFNGTTVNWINPQTKQFHDSSNITFFHFSKHFCVTLTEKKDKTFTKCTTGPAF